MNIATRKKNCYNDTHYDRINFMFPVGLKDKYKASASARNMSVNTFIQKSIECYSKLDIRKYIIYDTYGEGVLFESSAPSEFIERVCEAINENGKGTDIEQIFISAGYYYNLLHDTALDNILLHDLLADNQDAMKFDLCFYME